MYLCEYLSKVLVAIADVQRHTHLEREVCSIYRPPTVVMATLSVDLCTLTFKLYEAWLTRRKRMGTFAAFLTVSPKVMSISYPVCSQVRQ